MHIDIPDDLHRRLEQLAKGTGQDVGTLVCEAIEQRLALEERKKRPQESSAWQPFSDQDPFLSLIGSRGGRRSRCEPEEVRLPR